MRLSTVCYLAVLAVGCGRVADSPADEKREAQFKGKAVSVWARQLADKDVPTRIEAANALKAVGPEAKGAVANLKTALKERAWELFVAQGGKSANRTFTSVSSSIGSTKPRQPTKDEIIADLRRELEQKKRDLAALEKQQEEMFADPCLHALVGTLLAIDRRELEAMVPAQAVQSTKTFTKVSNKIGSPTDK